MAQKDSKKAKKLLKNRKFSFLLLFLGLVLFLFGFFGYNRDTILSFVGSPSQPSSSLNPKNIPLSISIPSVNINVSIIPSQITSGVWQTTREGASFLNTSAGTKEGGNTVIYGHNITSIFANLPYLKVGEKVYIKTVGGETLTYKVTEKYFVKPDRVDLVSQDGEEELTIFTCWGLFDTQRAVIKAEPI